jgi:hypothetical protein
MKSGKGKSSDFRLPSSCQSTVSKGCNPQLHLMRPFAPCFASAEDGQPVYLLNTRVSMMQLMRHPVHQRDPS